MKNLIALLNIIFLSLFAKGQSIAFNWAKQIGGNQDITITASIIDNSSNLYTTGYFRGTVDFDPGSGVFNLTSSGNTDIFISKLDSSGNFIWAKKLGGILNEYSYAIETDASRNVYITGYFQDTVDFDPGPGTFKLKTHGYIDIFILKLDSIGNFIWAKNMGGTLVDVAYGIAVDASGNVYTTGYFGGTADFDPNPDTFNLTSSGIIDIFILKLDSLGNLVWAKDIGGTSNDYGYSIDNDSLGNVYITGFFENSVDFDPGPGTFNLITNGGRDMFVAKFDPLGNFVWAKKMGGISGASQAIVNSIAISPLGFVYTTGAFTGTIDFNPDNDSFNLTSQNGTDIFISKLNPSGNFVWAKKMGGNTSDGGFDIAIDASENVYTTGNFYSIGSDFDPGAGTYNLSSAGSADVFVSKLDSSGHFIWAKSMGGKKYETGISIAVNKSGSIYTTGNFNDTTVDFNPASGIFNLTTLGDQDIFIQKMGPCLPVNFAFNSPACDTFTLNAQKYSISGIYSQTLSNVFGCDSIITVNLTIKHSSSLFLSQIACNSFKLNNTTYSTSGAYKQILINTAGCDSIITLNLTINSTNDSVLQSGNLLTANATGAIYQWVRCPAYSIIAGATNRNYTASINGDYAVIVTQNGCTDTSICFTVGGVGIENSSLYQPIKISPNPSNKLFKIQTSNPKMDLQIEIYNTFGSLIHKVRTSSEESIIDLSSQPNGLYFVKVINDENKCSTVRIVKVD